MKCGEDISCIATSMAENYVAARVITPVGNVVHTASPANPSIILFVVLCQLNRANITFGRLWLGRSDGRAAANSCSFAHCGKCR